MAGQEAVLGSNVLIWVSTGPDGTAPLPEVPPADEPADDVADEPADDAADDAGTSAD